MEESPSFNFSNLALAHAASSIFIDSSTNTSQAPTSVASAAPSPAFGGINIGSAGFSNEDTVYSARYMARFKHTLDVNCNGPAPDIALFCLTGQIEILGTSDDTIVCVGPLTMNGTTVTLCSITCAEEECDSVYIDRGLQHPDLYGSIEFTCSGLTVSDVQGSLFVPGNTNGSCSALSGSNGFNVMLASLGVNCNDEYIFDDGYMECTGGSPINLFDGDYECFTGAICGEESCSVTIDDMSVTADHFRFPGCIETNDGSIISDIDLPTSEPLPIGTYSAIFSANMRIQLSDLYDEEDCTTHASGLKFTCLNGAIDLLESPYIMSCQASDNAIECIEASGFTPVNEWVTFVYVSFLPCL